MKSISKYFFAVVLILAGMLTLSYLQHRFDVSDLKHAVGAVRGARPLGPQDKTLEEKVIAVYQVKPEQIAWEPTLESKFKGLVNVRVVLPSGDKNLVYQVDLVRLVVLPQTPEAKELSHRKVE